MDLIHAGLMWPSAPHLRRMMMRSASDVSEAVFFNLCHWRDATVEPLGQNKAGRQLAHEEEGKAKLIQPH